MTYTSFAFAIFAIITIAVYYLIPRKEYQWAVLLVASLTFYLYNSYRFVFYIACTAITIYLAAKYIEDYAKNTKAMAKQKKAELSMTLFQDSKLELQMLQIHYML